MVIISSFDRYSTLRKLISVVERIRFCSPDCMRDGLTINAIMKAFGPSIAYRGEVRCEQFMRGILDWHHKAPRLTLATPMHIARAFSWVIFSAMEMADVPLHNQLLLKK